MPTTAGLKTAAKYANEAKKYAEVVDKAQNGDHYKVKDGMDRAGSLKEDTIEHVKDTCDAAQTATKMLLSDDTKETAKEVIALTNDGATDVMEAVGSGDGTAAIIDAADTLKEEITETLVDSGASLLAEEIADALPLVGLCTGAYHLTWGTAYSLAGASYLASGIVVGAVGCLGGVIASPFDGGEILRSSAKLAQSQACWGSCVLGEGAFGAIKSAATVVGQVPGTKVVTIPVGVLAKGGSKGCRWLRCG